VRCYLMTSFMPLPPTRRSCFCVASAEISAPAGGSPSADRSTGQHTLFEPSNSLVLVRFLRSAGVAFIETAPCWIAHHPRR
jgi:hypothetical protein